jgi:hypothetical protein
MVIYRVGKRDADRRRSRPELRDVTSLGLPNQGVWLGGVVRLFSPIVEGVGGT